MRAADDGAESFLRETMYIGSGQTFSQARSSAAGRDQHDTMRRRANMSRFLKPGTKRDIWRQKVKQELTMFEKAVLSSVNRMK